MNNIRLAIGEIAALPDLVSMFIRDMNAVAQARPAYSFPWSGTEEIIPASGSCWISRLFHRPLVWKYLEQDLIEVSVGGKCYVFSSATGPLFGYLAKTCPVALDKFYAAHRDLEETELKRFLTDLVTHGIIGIERVR